jgi:hypothetical protein
MFAIFLACSTQNAVGSMDNVCPMFAICAKNIAKTGVFHRISNPA